MQKHALHVSNIANANVPEFKAKAVDFEDRLNELAKLIDQNEATNAGLPQKALNQKISQLVGQLQADIYEDPYLPINPNGGTVNPEKEQVEIGKNTLMYEATVQMVNKKLAMKKYAAGGGL